MQPKPNFPHFIATKSVLFGADSAYYSGKLNFFIKKTAFPLQKKRF